MKKSLLIHFLGAEQYLLICVFLCICSAICCIMYADIRCISNVYELIKQIFSSQFLELLLLSVICHVRVKISRRTRLEPVPL